MYKTKLTPRQIDICFYLLSNNDWLSSTRLAQHFDVSVRTIKNEMAYVRDWLNEQSEELTSERGKGYKIIAAKERKRALSQLLHSKEKVSSPMDHQTRVKYIIIDLFFSEKPLTIMYFSDKLLVSPNTIFNDFSLLQEEFKKSNIYVKSNHYGYSLAGKESSIRDVVSNLLQSELTNFDISNFIDSLLGKEKDVSEFTSTFANEGLKKIYQTVVSKVVENLATLNKEIEDYTIFSFIIRLCLSIARLQNHIALGKSPAVRTKDKINNFLYAIYQETDCLTYEEEFRYVSSEQANLGSVDIPKFTKEIISKVSELSQIDFAADSQLFQNLYTHFSLTLTKSNNLNGYNPFVNDLKIKQLEIFNFVEEACADYLPASIKADDSFVGYVTLHFLASVERQKNLERKISVLYVCSTGVGVASFIQQKIAKAIKGIEIVGFSSVINVAAHIEKLKPDLIVSVFPIEKVSVPVIEVNALLTSEDLQQIQDQVNLLLNAGMGSIVKKEKQPEKDLTDLSIDLISKGFGIYSDLKTLFDRELPTTFMEGFLLHILLMVNRVFNHEQYQSVDSLVNSAENTALGQQIKEICQRYDVALSPPEIAALLPYYEYFDQQNSER